MVKGVLNRKKVTFRIKDRSIIKSAVGEAVPAGGTTGPTWIGSHLTERPHYIRLKDISSTGAPRVTVLAPLLFTLYTSDFCSVMCQKFADDTGIMGCVRNGRDDENRNLVSDFVWSQRSLLQLNTSKNREFIVNYGKSRPCQ